MDETIRRIQLIFNSGFGAITSLRSFTGTIKHPSLDAIPWRTSDKIFDLRLQKILRVNHFKVPPESDSSNFLGVAPFPKMHYCPSCNRLRSIDDWYPNGFNKVYRLLCNGCRANNHRSTLIPSRFIMICPEGHMDDFPYFEWVHRYRNCSGARNRGLTLNSSGYDSSLKNIKIICLDCKSERTMEGALNPKNHVASDGSKRYKCAGNHPELMKKSTCNQFCNTEGGLNANRMRFVLRTASNIYFPIINSAILLPTQDKPEIDFISRSTYFKDIISGNLSEAKSELVHELLCDNLIQEFGISEESAKEYIKLSINLLTDQSDLDWESFKFKEYLALSENNETRNFISTLVDGDELLKSRGFSVTSITEVERIRKIASLSGYTRVASLANDDTIIDGRNGNNRIKVVDLRVKDPNGNNAWLPAVELFGEGILIKFSDEVMERKEEQCANRIATLRTNVANYNQDFGSTLQPPNARFVALHSLSHQIIKEISFEIGYNLASIRERMYCNDSGPNRMNGIFIYIVEQDVMGTLGGLSRLAKDEKIYTLIKRSIEHSEWCSNDPVCFESDGQSMGGLNLAACHSCLLLPETCCEHGNRFLDRDIMQRFFSH